MTIEFLYAAAGLAELSPDEARKLEQTLLLVAAIPASLYWIAVVMVLAALFGKPSVRDRLKGWSLLAGIILLATSGLILSIPMIAFIPSLMGR